MAIKWEDCKESKITDQPAKEIYGNATLGEFTMYYYIKYTVGYLAGISVNENTIYESSRFNSVEEAKLAVEQKLKKILYEAIEELEK